MVVPLVQRRRLMEESWAHRWDADWDLALRLGVVNVVIPKYYRMLGLVTIEIEILESEREAMSWIEC